MTNEKIGNNKMAILVVSSSEMKLSATQYNSWRWTHHVYDDAREKQGKKK